ncbi:MAG: T9SS type A sorting domain-containing protein [Bacteroidetes bacterium]|nr:T9SS type A sorting domain-containing protein [Bacteroidota bacterium]
MKKILLTISVVALSFIGAMAQSPDFSFETWNNVQFSTTIQDPQGWASLNTLNVFTATPKSVFKETTSPFGGTASAKITTVKIIGAAIPNPYQTGDIDTAGLLTIGQIVASPPSIKYGYNYTWRSQVLSFQCKYTPMAGDSAFVLATLTKWNGTSRDTIAIGKYATGATTTSYSLNSITLNYDPAFASVVPDSQQIFISSSIYSHNGAKIGSTFYIDDIAWSGYNSTNEINSRINNVIVYPNPSTNNISIVASSVDAAIIRITDITGRLIGTYSMTDNEANIQTSTFASGIYIYSILDQKKNVMSRGRFEITK